jgi:class 3 adenylate cyclase/tetratricopeptide (TPR) repeat protein
MFCDLVGSTPLAGNLDPETTRDVLLEYQDVSAAAVKRYDGHIANYWGDGLLVYFGYPRAHEDAARRALLAALEIVASVRRLSPEVERRFGVRMQVRVAVHTGEVVVADMGAGGWIARDDIVGPTPNLASRLQNEAEPDSVLASEASIELVQGYFAVDDLGVRNLRGIAEPVRLYRVRGETSARSRLGAGRPAGMLVGRQNERERLQALWRQVREGETPRPVLLLGEPGMGKTRLVQFIRGQAEWAGGERLEAYCSPYHANSPFHPMVGLIEMRSGISDEDDGVTRLTKLEDALRADTDLGDAIPALAPLCGIPLGDSYEALTLSPESVRERVFTVLAAWFDGVAARGPLLLIVEDIHWADGSTLEFLSRLAAASARQPMLAILTTRPEQTSRPWPAGSVEEISLQPLSDEERADFLGSFAGGESIPDELARRLADRSNGVPLFLEELARAYLTGPAQSSEALPAADVPASLRDLLTERLERVADKEVAQVAATIGVEVPVSLLQAVTALDEETLTDRLSKLEGAGILERSSRAVAPTYAFHHVLVRDTAYASQLLTTRRDIHARIASALESGVAGEPEPAVLAFHCAEAQQFEKAIGYYIAAANNSRATAGHTEAVRQMDAALRLVERLPEGADRDVSELLLRLTRGGSIQATEGFASRAAALDFERAFRLCEGLGDRPELVYSLAPLWGFYLVAGDLEQAGKVSSQMQAAATRPEFSYFLPEVEACVGIERYFCGDIAEADAVLEQSREHFLARPAEQRVTPYWTLPNDPFAAALVTLAIASWMRGDHERSRARLDEARACAGEQPFPAGQFSIGYVAAYEAYLQHIQGQDDLGARSADLAVQVGTDHGFPFWQVSGQINALSCRLAGAGSEGAAESAEAIETLIGVWTGAFGAGAYTSCFLASRAEALLLAGDPQRALACLAEAQQATRRGECFHLAEIHRLKARALLQDNPTAIEEAAAELDRAIETARRQGARSFELRAAAARYRLLEGCGRAADAREALERAVEGFPSSDWRELIEVRELLAAAGR